MSVQQIRALVDFMEGQPELALGRCSRSKEGRSITKKLWQDCAFKLNNISSEPDCVQKTGDQWRLFYNEYKHRLLKKVNKGKMERCDAGGEIENPVKLTSIQDKLYRILSQNAGKSELKVHHASLNSGRQVSSRQVEAMIKFMRRHKDLAIGRVPTKKEADTLWKMLAQRLNSLSTGPSTYKPVGSWKKFYMDYKSKLKNKIHQQHQANGGLDEPLSLSALEGKLYEIVAPVWCANLEGNENPLEIEEYEVSPEKQISSPVTVDNMEVKVEFQSVQEFGTPLPHAAGVQSKTESASFTSRPKLKRPHSVDIKESDSEETMNVLAEIERAKLKLSREQLKVQKERNDIERSKVQAINNLAGAAWAILNVFGSTNGKKVKIDSSDDEGDNGKNDDSL